MKILAIEKEVPGIKDEDYTPFLKSEARKVWELFQRGIIREFYFTNDISHFAVLILECNGAAEAEDILKTLPLVEHNLISFDLKELIPYSGFSRLFEKNPN
ncbi:MAG: superoxide dismutase [Ignavibacteria bacterium]